MKLHPDLAPKYEIELRMAGFCYQKIGADCTHHLVRVAGAA
jgi:hypothetical protein